MNSEPKRFLGVRFKYHDENDETLLDENLHYELSILQPHIKGICETLYNWEILDSDDKGDTDRRLYPSIWIPLEGLSGRFPRKDNVLRLFELEVSVVDKDAVSFTLFENLTEARTNSYVRYQEAATANVAALKLGIRIRPKSS